MAEKQHYDLNESAIPVIVDRNTGEKTPVGEDFDFLSVGNELSRKYWEMPTVPLCGAIIGDIVGSQYQFGQSEKTKDFELFTAKSTITDDSVMT